LTVDGLIYASSMVMLYSARRGMRAPSLARWLLGLGIVATLAANVAHGLGHGLGHGLIGAAVGAWPAVALVGSYELLMMIIRGTQTPTAALRQHGGAPVVDPLGEQAAVAFAARVDSDGSTPGLPRRRARHDQMPMARSPLCLVLCHFGSFSRSGTRPLEETARQVVLVGARVVRPALLSGASTGGK
jgi:hypothetical protein